MEQNKEGMENCLEQYMSELQAPCKIPRRNARTRDEDRARIIECHEKGGDFIALAAVLGIQRTTAYGIIRNHQMTGRVEAAHGGGRPKKVDDETLDFCLSLLEANPFVSLQELLQGIRAMWPKKSQFSVCTLSRSLEGELVTLKQPRDMPVECDGEGVKQARQEYAQWMFDIGLKKHRIYVDDIAFNLWTKRAHCRGESIHRIVGGQGRSNVTVLAACSDRVGILYHEIHIAAVTPVAFNNFMASLEAILQDENAVVLMNYLTSHHEIPEIYPELSIRYLPPISPFLNPMESCFNVVKSTLKEYLHNADIRCTAQRAQQCGMSMDRLQENTLTEGVNRALCSVNRDTVISNYTNSDSYINKCMERQDIF